jgi:RimJ/RimL family protein N-acetyltransferase
MIYAETDRLLLRALARADLPRLAELIGDWEVARWLVAVPYPYRSKTPRNFTNAWKSPPKMARPNIS